MILAKEMVLKQVQVLIDAHIVEEMEEFVLIKVFLQFNKPVPNVQEVEKK